MFQMTGQLNTVHIFHQITYIASKICVIFALDKLESKSIPYTLLSFLTAHTISCFLYWKTDSRHSFENPNRRHDTSDYIPRTI